jgi:CelD/BcsL family acetyltransferase involved in cellulose biosynthesis
MSNLFSSDAFLLAAAEVCYPGERAEVALVSVQGRRFRLLRTNGKIRTDLPYYDFVEPETAPGEPAANLSFLPRVCVDNVPAEGWESVAAERQLKGSPWIDWRGASSWEEYVRRRRQVASRAFSSERKARRLERELGPVRMQFFATDRGLIDRCARWKSTQYQKTGFVDMFASGRVIRLFHRMFDEGALVVSCLHAGDRPVAIHLGAMLDGRFYSWVPAYDIDAGAYSPGLLLLERMLEESYRLGHREYDFLIGPEAYKFHYATDVRLIGPLGAPNIGVRAWKRVRETMLSKLRGQSALYASLQRARRWYLQKRLP